MTKIALCFILIDMKKSELIFSALLVPLDWILLVLSGFAAYALRFHPRVVEIRPVIFNLPFPEYFQIVASVATVFILIFAISGLYSITSGRSVAEELIRVILACSTGFLVVVLYLFWQREFFSSRFIILAAFIFTILFVSIGRVITRLVQRVCFRRGIGLHNLIIIGNSSIGERLAGEYHRNPSLGFRIVSRIKEPPGDIVSQVKQIASNERVDDILFVDNGKIASDTVFNLVNWASLSHISFHYSSDYLNWPAAGVDITSIAGIPVMEFKRTPLDGWGRILKRAFDIIVSTALIIIFAPIMLLIALIIKLDSKGGVFFSELDDGSPLERIGQYEKPFRYFKFRTMIPKSDSMRYSPELQALNARAGSPMVKIKNDPRITRFGFFLRRWSLDELSELFLVLVGKMSLVGPRPHLPEEVAKYQPHQKIVFTIKPGMTGIAQISGRSDLTFGEEMTLDAYYIKNWSLKFDLQIIMRTPAAVFRRRTEL